MREGNKAGKEGRELQPCFSGRRSGINFLHGTFDLRSLGPRPLPMVTCKTGGGREKKGGEKAQH